MFKTLAIAAFFGALGALTANYLAYLIAQVIDQDVDPFSSIILVFAFAAGLLALIVNV